MIEYIEYIPQVEQAILPLLTAVGGLAQVGMSLAQRNKLQSQQQEAQDAKAAAEAAAREQEAHDLAVAAEAAAARSRRT